MERTTGVDQAKEIMGRNFISPSELSDIADMIGVINPYKIKAPIPRIPYTKSVLKKIADDFIMLLGIPETSNNEVLTLSKMRSFFGIDPLIKEPCFYNQDWYVKEDFATKETLNFNWYLVKKEVFENSRGMNPDDFLKQQGNLTRLPSAVLCSFTFFAWYFRTKGEILWKHDYIWCKDKDYHNDQVYVGRYLDPAGINKNGFSIHRHLSIKSCYGVISEL
jgi:hypothetical protein